MISAYRIIASSRGPHTRRPALTSPRGLVLSKVWATRTRPILTHTVRHCRFALDEIDAELRLRNVAPQTGMYDQQATHGRSIEELGRIVAGRYRLDRALARGGMGSVWVARHLQLEVDVAVKFMTAEAAASPSARSRFEREAKACAKLKSPHIVQILD